MSRPEQEPQRSIPKKLIVAVGIGWLAIAAVLDHLEYPTLGRAIPTPTPQRILTPLPVEETTCPNGSLPVVTKNNALCRQSQLTPVALPR